MPAPRHLERIEWRPRGAIDLDTWPYRIPAVRQLIDDGGLDIPPGITVLVGENGSGKSTLIEAFAAVYPRLGAESSSAISVTGPGGSAEDSPLHWHLRARTHPLAAPGGFFLRAETMHGYLAEIDRSAAEGRAWGGERLQHRSHGESFLAVLRHRFADRGVYSQAVVATHSPVLAALPGVTTYEVGAWGIRPAAWEDLDLVQSWRDFLAAPQRFFRYLLSD